MWVEHATALGVPGKRLLYHNYEHGTGRRRGYGWGRGNGWALLGLLDLIEVLPDNCAGRNVAVGKFQELAAATAWQTASAAIVAATRAASSAA